MTRIANNGSGKTDWYGAFGTLLASAFTGQVMSGLNVTAQTSPNMTVKVNPGAALIPTGSGATASASLVRNDTAAGENVTIATANGSNPRNDLVVAYYDITVIDATNPNNPGALKFAAVTGTPAATPADPSGSSIQSAVGAANPYIVLARVVVGTSVTQVTTSNISDLRIIATPSLANKVVTAPKIDFTTGIWWEEIGRTTLASTGTSIVISNLPPRKYLHIKLACLDTGGTIAPAIQFNSDSTNTYTRRYSVDGGTNTTGAATSAITLATAAAQPVFGNYDVINISNVEKLLIGKSVVRNNAGTGYNPDYFDISGKWVNTSGQISTVTILSFGGTGSFAAGSEVVILGHD